MPRVTPSFITIDAQGRVSADFSGHVHAAGLDLDAGTTNSPPNDRRVRWLRTSDGARIAEIISYELSPNDAESVHQVQHPTLAGTNAGVDRVYGGTQSQVFAFASQDNSPNPPVSETRVLVTHDKQSGYVQTRQGGVTGAAFRTELEWDSGAGLARLYSGGALVKSW